MKTIVAGTLVWAVCVFSNLTLADETKSPTTTSAPSITHLRKVLLEDKDEHVNGVNDFSEIKRKHQAISELKTLGTPEAVEVLSEYLVQPDAESKMDVLLALGQIGTKEAVDAIDKFETWAEKHRQGLPDFQFDEEDYDSDFFKSYPLSPVAKFTDRKRQSWTLFRHDRSEAEGFWLSRSIGEDKWAPPIYLSPIDCRDKSQYQLKVNDELVVITMRFKLENTIRDFDKDGLPDSTEFYLKTNPRKADTDGDGVPDAKDPCPTIPKHTVENEYTKIRQAVFTTCFAISNRTAPIVLPKEEDYSDQEYYGYPGPVIVSAKLRYGLTNIINFQVTITSPTTATVGMFEGGGPLAGCVYTLTLQKVHGKWVVIKIKAYGVSRAVDL